MEARGSASGLVDHSVPVVSSAETAALTGFWASVEVALVMPATYLGAFPLICNPLYPFDPFPSLHTLLGVFGEGPKSLTDP